MEDPGHEKLTTEDLARRARRKEPMRQEDDRAAQSRRPILKDDAIDVAAPGSAPASMAEGSSGPLLPSEDAKDFRARWQTIQTGFVDEPRRAVKHADELVAEIMQRLAQSLSDQRQSLESGWEHSDKVSTEDLRMALRRYRSFLDRLLSF